MWAHHHFRRIHDISEPVRISKRSFGISLPAYAGVALWLRRFVGSALLRVLCGIFSAIFAVKGFQNQNLTAKFAEKKFAEKIRRGR
jgi:hypothetical protein